MAAKPQNSNESKKKRKSISADGNGNSNPKKLKSSTSNVVHRKGPNKPFKLSKQGDKQKKPQDESKKHASKDDLETKRQHRLRAKELAEARKKKRKKHYTLEQELALMWEKIRRRNIAKEERSKLVTEALQKMKGKIPEIARSHVSSRVLQTCVKYCSPEEGTAVFLELRPHFISLASNTYAVHLVAKMLDNASKEQLAEFISSLHGHVASLLRHMVGSLVIEHAYNLGNATQKQALLIQLYSPELQLFKDLVSIKENRLIDVISKLKLQKASVLRHMSSVLQPILEKGIVDHSIIHRALVEYLSIADQSSGAEVIQQLSGPLLVRLIHTKDGSRLGILCIKHGSAKERKKIVKGLKGLVDKTSRDKYGNMVLVCIMSVVDDTKLVSKIIINELQIVLKELMFDQFGRRPLLQLLHPNFQRYFSPEDLTSLTSSVPSLSVKELSDTDRGGEEDGKGTDGTGNVNEVEGNEHRSKNVHAREGGKKDPFTRRKELLVNSGLAEKLIDACSEMAGDLLKSKFGKEVIYEVASGGTDGILRPTLDEKLNSLYEAIASVVAEPKSDDSEEEHPLEQFHSSRTLRKLILDCPAFATTLWEKALEGKCAVWAKGHSSKVLSAFLETSDSKVSELAKRELQPLMDSGILKLHLAGDKVDNEG